MNLESQAAIIDALKIDLLQTEQDADRALANLAGDNARLKIELESRDELLKTCYHALRSYHFGNGSPDLAKEVADKIEVALGKA